jgi:glycosyltransferase involved in cell wall biosynthesis
VIFDGIDTDQICPNLQVTIELNGFGKVTTTDEVITFVSRGLEPYRGIHTFIRSLPEILRRRPNALVIVVGSDEVSYGRALEEETYLHRYLAEIEEKADLSRVYFVGHLPRDQLTKVLQLSSVHVYLTYPFVLSWSMLEAMSAGSVVIGSRTPPVQEVIEDGRNGLLVDFFNPMEIAEAVDRVFNHPDRMRTLREEARQTIRQRYDLKTVCLPKQLELIRALLNNTVSQED